MLLATLPAGVLGTFGLGFAMKDMLRIQSEARALDPPQPSTTQVARLVAVANAAHHWRRVVRGEVEDGEFRAFGRLEQALDELGLT